MHDGGLTVTRKIHFSLRNKGRREIRPGPQPVPDDVPAGRVPRVARLMALAIRFDDLIRSGALTDQADLARLGHVSRARVTQIMNLLHLAPAIQEEILFLPRVMCGSDPIRERQLRPIAATAEWRQQRRMWQKLRSDR
ncbi:MAG: hypothetical protein KBG29_01225 [Pseudomonadales bacterium]|nr:hypothetical protein [Pseudomonadales bacterium]